MKIRTAILMTALVLAPIAACGDDDGASGFDPSATTSAPDTAPEAVEASLDIHYAHADADVDFSYGIECSESGNEVTGDAEQAEIDPNAACEALMETAVVERLLNGPDHDVCTEIYGGPDLAEVSGTIGVEEVETTFDRSNGCAIDDWDEILGDILPPAIGVQPNG